MDRSVLVKKSQAFAQQAVSSKWTYVTVTVGLVALGIIRGLPVLRERARLEATTESDPSLLKKHSRFESYTTASGHTYRRIRAFYKEHQQASQLPKDLPLLVLMHGLGGSAAQFAPLLTSLINQAPCLAIDLPGCGRSDFSPGGVKPYTTQALAELLAVVISRYRDSENNQKVILIGHSMGCSINTLLGSSTSPLSHLLGGVIIGMVAICPKGTPLTEHELKALKRMNWIPIPIFDLFRRWDRRGGLASSSVSRVVGKGADSDSRKKQLKYNEQSESGPFLRILKASTGRKGIPGKDVWSGIKVPLFLVAGDSDSITPAAEVELISGWLTSPQDSNESDTTDHQVKVPALPTTAGNIAAAEQKITMNPPNENSPRTDSGTAIKDDQTSTKHSFALKTTIFPEPAAHGLMYSSSTVRILSGMIENFLSQHIDERLGAAWQLNTLNASGKWDVKNLKKWQAIDNCSEPIGGIFRAMKTMREVDEVHSPKEFIKRWSYKVVPDGVAAVLDISHESPVYHPSGLEEAGVEYLKFPTVSKEKPKPEEVDHFIELVDELRKQPRFHPTQPDDEQKTRRPCIGVHCHYGFNRTGFVIVCYLVEREGYRLQDAIDEFRQKRPPGVKHEHFVNELYVRYAVKMERRATIVE